MLSHEENILLTRIGPGTPMGEMLRRYWHPVACSAQVTGKPLATKILGEELVVYRGASGSPVLMERRCAHRRLALDYGRVEGDSLRCPYHGWLYDRTGQCLAQPAEPEGSGFKEKVRLKSYAVQEFGGLVFGYLGPEPAPLLPLYDVLRMEDGTKGVQIRNINANWLNHVENIVDISHLAWLHGHSFPAYGAKKVTYRWDRQEYGLDNVMLVDGVRDEETHISCYAFPLVNRFNVPPVTPGGEQVRSLLYRVPVDDESTLLYFVRFTPGERRALPVNLRVDKLGVYKQLDSDWWGIDNSDQDRMAIEQQGVVADRANEHLGASDGGIILMRRMLRESLAAIAAGKDPLCIIRDPAKQKVDFRQRSLLMDERQAEGNYAGGFGLELAAAAASG
jgi:5,5'-dehydrodivanillate O-demethylase oxygenase subunit